MSKLFKRHPGLFKENAQTMVEFALVFPILLLITYGIIEFGRIVFIYTSVTSAAREGARYGAAAGEGAGGVRQFADCGGIRTAVRNATFLVTIPNDSDIEIWYALNHTSGFLYDCASIGSHISQFGDGPRIRVIVRASYSPIIPFVGLDQSPVLITRQNTRTILMDIKIEP
ncbi:MAG: hypothetical protein A2Y88_14940 [Chloroflexi bacterium RBG_13_48_10]|nr:MAG: hypothetical protein A2Y88_14940 [Chloroflexi bacterium RBG_13_48_10]